MMQRGTRIVKVRANNRPHIVRTFSLSSDRTRITWTPASRGADHILIASIKEIRKGALLA
jgi:hypothetical protein